MEGQECLVRLQKSSWMADDDGGDDIVSGGNFNKKYESSTRLWGDEELQMFHSVTRSDMACRGALLDDLDGSTFVREISRIAETGLTYVEGVGGRYDDSDGPRRPEEPLRFVLDTFRGLLDLVGFTSRTVSAGMSLSLSTHDPPSSAMVAAGSSTALLDEVVAFRAAVRSAALGAIREKKEDGVRVGSDAANKILKLCDELRDDILPKFGVEILDGKVIDKKNVVVDDRSGKRGWRHCSPRGSRTMSKS